MQEKNFSAKRLSLLGVLLLLGWVSHAQVQWTWVGGDSLSNLPATYGTKGVADPSNHPPAKFQGAMWADQSGNLWLFGGAGIPVEYNDMWRYNTETKEWTWMNGANTADAYGSYTTARGVASVNNSPGARQYIPHWTDKDGNFWIFGGQGFAASGQKDYLNDLWKYNPTDHTWTWVKGDSSITNQSPHYGTRGVADIKNIPGGRRGSVTWTDTTGNLWLFGGQDGSLFRSDLWKYNIKDNTWTWMGGDTTNISQNRYGVYGTKGVASATNWPGGRQVAASWVDGKGNLWMFGGQGAAKSGFQNQFLSDLWKYDISSSEWTWVGGVDTNNARGRYGNKGVASPGNWPGARMTDAHWKDAEGNFWLFGEGWSFSAIDSVSYGYMGDLWKYNPSSGAWSWHSGDSTFGLILSGQGYAFGKYGTRGVPSPDITPGGRAGGPGCVDKNGNFWLYGGYGQAGISSRGLMNDLWKLEVCTALKQPAAIEGADSVCAGVVQTYAIPGMGNAKTYAWLLPDGWSGSSAHDSIQVVTGDSGGVITIKVMNNCDTVIQTMVVGVYQLNPIINVSGFTLSTVATYATYQWLLNGSLISGATQRDYEVKHNGDYQVVVTNNEGCTDTSDIYTVNNAGIEAINTLAGAIKVYPNPATGVVNIQSPVKVDAVLTDVTGRTIKQMKQANHIDIGNLASGLYLLRISLPDGTLIKVEKVVKQEP